MKGAARPKNRGEGSETETESFLVGGRPESSEIFWQHFKISLDQCFVCDFSCPFFEQGGHTFDLTPSLSLYVWILDSRQPSKLLNSSTQSGES